MAKGDCKYCDRSDELFGVAFPVTKFEASDLYLMRNQAYPGRCILVLKEHRTELSELAPETLSLFASELARTAAALKSLFGADKINYAVFGDTVPHLHFHVVPKRRDGLSWGKPFEMDPAPSLSLDERGYEDRAAGIRAALARLSP